MSLSVKKNDSDEIQNKCNIFIVPKEDEHCILCGCKTDINRKTPADKRQYYVDGCGQLCGECWNELYGFIKIEGEDFVKDVGVKKVNVHKRESLCSVHFNDSACEKISLQEKPLYDFTKRIFDIVSSLLALIVLSPVLIITMIVIYIDDPGPVIYKQIRIGKSGKKFIIYKFRSMKINADAQKKELLTKNQSQGATFKMKHDPRITNVGKFIRKTSVDELPQLINILKGDMSVIGPRPFIPEEQEKLPDDRLLVKPGLSCYWQIGGKNSLSTEEQIELDRRYIRERSFLVDINIIFKTFFVIFNKENR